MKEERDPYRELEALIKWKKRVEKASTEKKPAAE